MRLKRAFDAVVPRGVATVTFPDLLPFSKQVMQAAIEVERTEAAGRALGLSAEEISEVVCSWQANASAILSVDAWFSSHPVLGIPSQRPT